MPWNVQLAFQGGGARFIQHLAVAEAFQRLETEGVVQVNRVAGTSAGSLAAAIVAAGISAEEAAAKLRESEHEFVKKLSTPGLVGSAWKFCNGESLVNPRHLDEVFRSFWTQLTGSDQIQLISSLSKPLIVVAANVSTREPKIYGAKDELIDALVHSCAIPVVYRSVRHLSDDPVVDGVF